MYRDLNKKAFMDQARKLVPSVTDDMVEESFAGVMAQIFNHDGSPAADFIFERNMNQGTTLNVRNAPTPACTASFAIAEEVVDLAAEASGRRERDSNNPTGVRFLVSLASPLVPGVHVWALGPCGEANETGLAAAHNT